TLTIGKPYTPAKLHITVRNLSPDNTTVKSVSFNGKAIEDWRIHHNELIKGGELEFIY
ncbi:MAG: glycoside hydrolase family 92 protein, partial [Bacteroidales bacterium]|nr:glycoside hydrolase family 92 protein [Bacteroidales bacterium]